MILKLEVIHLYLYKNLIWELINSQENLEEDIDMKTQCRIKNLPDPISIREPSSKNYVDYIFKIDFDFNDANLKKVKFVKVNNAPAVDSLLTQKVYFDNAINQKSLVTNNRNTDFNIFTLTSINSITLKTQAINDNQVSTKADVHQFHQEKERTRRDLGIDFYKESNDLVRNNRDNGFNENKLRNLDSLQLIETRN